MNSNDLLAQAARKRLARGGHYILEAFFTAGSVKCSCGDLIHDTGGPKALGEAYQDHRVSLGFPRKTMESMPKGRFAA